MAEQGNLLAAGPFLDDGDLRGIFLFRTTSLAEAEALAASDPAVRAAIGEFTANLRLIGLGVTIVMTGLLALVTWLIVHGYDNRLAEINENLENIVRRRTASLLQSRSAVILGLAKLADYRDSDTGQTGTDLEKHLPCDPSREHSALGWLRETELDNDDNCLVRRTISAGGRSRAWINGTAVTLGQLAELG